MNDGAQALRVTGEASFGPTRVPCGPGRAWVGSWGSPARAGNQDAALVLPLSPSQAVLAVADGVGGYRGGARAARTTVEVLAETVQERASGTSLREAVLDGLERANQAVLALKLGAAATVAVAILEEGTVRSVHAGDAVVLLTSQRGRVRLRTVDHSPTGYGVAAGLLERAEAVHHDERHLVTNLVGSTSMTLELGPRVPFRTRDTLLLASDGLFDNLYPREVIERLRKGYLRVAIAKLAERAHARMSDEEAGTPSHPDDLTLILFRLHAARSAKHRRPPRESADASPPAGDA